jgi:hypothetical protein
VQLSGSTDELVLVEEKGELLVHGRRRIAIEAEAFIEYLNGLCGTRVAEVVCANIQYQTGKQDCQRVRLARPQASAIAIIDELIRSDLVSGVGIVKVNLPESSADPVFIEISNPCLKTTLGAGRSFDFAYWAGALGLLFGRGLDVKDVIYDSESNVKKCHLVPREPTSIGNTTASRKPAMEARSGY